jgi:hypothetical protein
LSRTEKSGDSHEGGRDGRAAERFVCIHGHFYQPPRENPWLEEIEREESAQPFHDWNERIAEECYKPNAAARILDAQGRIFDLKNNYEHLSFNFGPTLLRWMARHSPVAYQSILDADRASVERSAARGAAGHGNALAQVYNHVILPLANLRDKHTQIRWGLRDFEFRFRRKAEGMWLAETAVDRETLTALAENGVRFTILSPYQAKRYRFLDGSAWVDAEHGHIPTGRAYLYQQHGKRPIHLFFYDGAIAKGIAFERMLADASHLVGAVDHAHRTRRGALPDEPWLVHTATDGESYGHHFAHGDMALAAAFARLEAEPHTRIVSYASFLASHAVRAEADILDVSAWSCAHGVGRWSRDCGCRIGGGPDWTQAWREPLREALNLLRDDLAVVYEREMARLVRDPWATRDAYIDVILEPARARSFASEQTRRSLDRDTMVRFFSLLEMQRAALLMFTSCGWFFDDISGGESIILMKYAARAIELARQTSDEASIARAEHRFLDMLARAESNLPGPQGEKVNGRELFAERARSVAVTPDKVVVSYALRALTEGARRSSHLYAYRVTHHEEVPLKKGAVPCLVGRVTVEDTRTLETADRVYALAHFGGLDFRCSTRPCSSDEGAHDIVERIRGAALEGTTAGMMKALDEAFGPDGHTLKDAFLDLRKSVARAIGAEKVSVLSVVGKDLLESHRALMISLRGLEVELPPHVQTLASHVLSTDALALIEELIAATHADGEAIARADIDFAWRAVASRLRAITEEAALLGLRLDVRAGAGLLGDAIVDALRVFGETGDAHRAAAIIRLVQACTQLEITPRLWDLQTELFRLIERAARDELLRDALRKQRALVEALDRFGGSTFGARLEV